MSLKIGLIVGSNRPNRVGRKVADWFMEQAKDTPVVELQLIDLQEVDLPFLEEPKLPAMGDYQSEHTKRWSKIIGPLDGYIFTVAEYNHGYPAVLKNAIDTLWAEWGHKPAAFVGYGTVGAASSIEHLTPTLAQLRMVPNISTAVRIVDARDAFDENGSVKKEHVRGSVEGLMNELVWWAEALQAARK